MQIFSKLQRYALATFFCGLALALALPLDAPSSCFFLAVMVTSLYGGKGPGLFSVGLSALAFDYFFLPHKFHLYFATASALRFATYLGAALLIVGLVEKKRRVEEARRVEQHRASVALQEALVEVQRSEDRLRQTISAIPALAWSTRANGSAEFFNQRWLDYTGLSPEQAMDYGWRVAVHPSDLRGLIEHWQSILTSGEPGEFEGRLRRFDEEYRWFLFRVNPFRDPLGRIVKWYGTNTDIEDRKRAEEVLRASERDLSLIIETIPALVWCAAPDGELTYVNQRVRDYTGTTLDELARHGWVDFLHPDDVAPTLRAWSQAVATGRNHEVEYRLRRSDGAYRWFHVLGQPARDNEGRVIRWYGLLLDTDDRKNTEEALRRTRNKLSRATQIATVGELAASIAHEINQPLAAVVANGHACLRWLSAQPPGLAKAHEAAERIVRDGKEAGEVVRRIRALFKRLTLEKLELDLNEVLGEVLRLLSGEIERRHVGVELDLAKDLPPVLGDRTQLQQVVFNLLLNGIEAMESILDRPRTLFIQSRQHNPGNVLVEIRDCGVGLADPERVFEAFFTTKENGLGMGLTICRSIIEEHRGRLWAVSAEGSGTTFCFTLPVQSAAL